MSARACGKEKHQVFIAGDKYNTPLLLLTALAQSLLQATMVKAIRFSEFGSSKVLKVVEDYELPPREEDEVREECR